MNMYEALIIVKLETKEEEKKEILERIHNITNYEDLGIKNLTYEVKGSKQGLYLDFNFKDTEENIINLQKYLRLNDKVIKFIIIRKEEEV